MPNDDSREKLHQASRVLVEEAFKSFFKEALENFLTDGGKIDGYKDFHDRDIGITEEQTKKFLDFIEISEEEAKRFLNYLGVPRKHPYIDPRKDPREAVYEKNKSGIFTVNYFVESTVYIWNVDHAEYE